MTAHSLLRLARRHRAPACVLRHIEDRAVAKTLAALGQPQPAPAWPWLFLALAAGIVAGATLLPNADPIAQIANGGEE